MRFINIILLLSFLIFSSCTFNPFIQDELPDDDKLFAEKFIDTLQLNDFNKAISFFSNDLLQTNTDWLYTILGRMNKDKAKNRKLVYQKILSTDKPYRATLLYELEYSNYWLLDEVTIDKIDGNYFISGLYNYHLNSSFEDFTSLKLLGKPFVNFLMLAVSIFTIIFILFVLIICIKTNLKNKWLWIIFILVGFAKINFNWGNSSFDYQIISIQLMGVGLTKFHPYGAWFLSTSIPIGAIIFLFKRRKLKNADSIEIEKKENVLASG